MSASNDTEAIRLLNGLQSNASVVAQNRKACIDYKNPQGLIDTRHALQNLGYTPTDFARMQIVHIAGSKGKGSTCAFLNRILHVSFARDRAGERRRVGMFTSPHLVDVRERIQLDGRPLSRRQFCDAFHHVYDRCVVHPKENGRPPPPYFRFLTLMAMHVFYTANVEVAILETGIGGRYDPTNIFPATVCGITSLGLEHTALLGKTLPQIAWQKAGIFLKGVPAFTVPHAKEAMDVIEEEAKSLPCPLHVVPPPSLEEHRPPLGLAGQHQWQNAALASCIALHLYPHQVTPSDVKMGLQTAFWPGRAQTIYLLSDNDREAPLLSIPEPTDCVLRLDGAHTAESLTVCQVWYDQVRDRRKKRILLFSFTGDRDVTTLLRPLASTEWDAVLFVDNTIRTALAEDESNWAVRTEKDATAVQERLTRMTNSWQALGGQTKSTAHAFIEEALQSVREMGAVECLITGSLLFVGNCLKCLQDKSIRIDRED